MSYIYVCLFLLKVPTCTEDHLETRLPGHISLNKASFAKTLEKKDSAEKFMFLASVIHSARKHSRGSKTTDYLNTATSIIDDILEESEIDTEEVYRRQTKTSTNICPETFMGGQFGYPLYEKGFVTEICDKAVSLSTLVTVIKYIDFNANASHVSSVDELVKFITSVKDTYIGLHLLIATDSVTFARLPKISYSWVKIIDSKQLDAGSALNSLIKEVTTPYVLVARNTNILTNDSRLERLIREIESLDVAAVGGSFRDQNGRWKNGCFQTVFKNSTLKYFEGYDESIHECLFCDYIHGPFITSTKYARKYTFKSFNESSGLYEDWFLRIFQKGHESVVCPDSMFHVIPTGSQSIANWKRFLEIWNSGKIFTPDGYSFSLECIGLKGSSKPSQALSPCVLQTASEAIKFIARTCEETGAICELQEGTALGAVKMGKVLPWDKDFDIRFLATNCTTCKKLEQAFQTEGLSFKDFVEPCCTKELKLGEIIDASLYYKGYYGDFTGHPVLESNWLIKAGVAPTKVFFDGQWINVPRNPGLFMRNRYGKEIYRHAEHWRYTGGKTHRMNYTTNHFLSCKYPGRHNCLERHAGDGNLQFVHLLP